MAIKLPKDIIESGYRFESCFPQPVIETEKKPDGSFKVYAKYDALLIDGFVKDIARDMNEKLSAELIDELLRLNGYVPERTCEGCSPCTRLREAEEKAARWDGIVRCRDCDLSTDDGEYCRLFASYEPIGGGDEFSESLAIVSPDGFCAWGERAEV